MAIAAKMQKFVDNGATIRKMFEEGARLKAIHGADKVFDFSIGNPNVPPPESFNATLRNVVAEADPGLHSYMPNAGLAEARRVIAARVGNEQGLRLEASHIIVTCGAAGGLNVVFKALLDPGDEVLVSSPYFVEYGFIADNHGGVLRSVPTLPDFSLDLEAFELAITPSTKIVLVNSPNNPTGKIYSRDTLDRLSGLLARKGKEYNRVIYLVSDEPYRKISYMDEPVPSVLAGYPHSIAVTSYSKELSLPGERIGFAAVNPRADDLSNLLDALALANRILGFVNAPSLMQRVMAVLIGKELETGAVPSCVDVSAYRRKRDFLAQGLKAAGYEFGMPEGAFYLFVKTPGGNDRAFQELLAAENILVVPGAAFGTPGYFRIAYCVADSTIENALPGFARAIGKAVRKP